jgi:hypothetical protein
VEQGQLFRGDIMALLVALTGFLCIACFVIGAKIGQMASKGEKIEMPKLDPLKAVRESRARKEVEKKQTEREKVLRNIDRYDGTSRGQEDVR